MMKDRKIENFALIDGKQVRVRQGWTILDAARAEGIHIPTLCHLEALEPYGGCRLCVVEVNGMRGFPTACTTPVRPGMEILTRTPGLQKLRKEILEFTLSEHPYTCLVCRDKKECTDFMHTTRKVGTITGCNFCTSNGDCELQDLVDYLDLTDMKFPITYRGIPPVKDNPFYDLDYNLCILCGRCVRICNEERNSQVLAFVKRGNATIVGTAFNETQLEAGCEYCGACVDVCPTGSISEKMGKWRGVPDRWARTTCTICPVACEMNVNTKEGRLVQIGPEPGKRTDPPQLCMRGKFLPAQLNDHPSRITTPLVRRDQKWVEVTWKDAFLFMSEKLDPYRGGAFGLIASGQETLEDLYALQKFTRTVMGSNHVDLNTPYPSGEILEQLHRYSTLHPPAGMKEIEKADTLLLIGMDASITHPLLENRIRKAATAGKRVILANSFPTRSSLFATDEHLYMPGGELRFLKDLLRSLERKEAGTPLGGSGKTVIIAGDPLLRHPQAGALMTLLFSIHRHMNDRGRCQLLFPGHSTGFYGSVFSGMHPRYLPGFQPISHTGVRQKWENLWQTRLSGNGGWSANEQLLHIGKEGIAAMMVVGDLPAHPRMAGLDLLVQCNMFRTPLSEYADILLPVTDFLENDGHVFSMEMKLKKVSKAVSPPGKVKSITGILSGLAAAMKENGFSGTPSRLFAEMKTLAGFKNGMETTDGAFSKIRGTRQKTVADTFPLTAQVYTGPFAYRGTPLNDLIPELGVIFRDGSIRMPASMTEGLGVADGERVRIFTPGGETSAACQVVHGMPDHSVCLVTNGKDILEVMDGLYPEQGTVPVRIEKEQKA